MTNTKAAQSSTKIPTVQDRIKAISGELVELKPSVTDDALAKASAKAGITPKTGREYLKGSNAPLHRLTVFLNTLKKELNIKAAA